MEDRQYPKGKRVLCYIIDLGIIFTISLLLVKFAVKPVMNMSDAERNRILSRIVHDDIIPRVKPGALDKIRFHKDRNDRLVIVTSTVDYLVKHIAKELGFTDYIAAPMEIIDGKLTGNTCGLVPYQEGKVTRIKNFLKENQLTLDDSYAYGDSINDLPMLQICEHKFAIDPNEVLLKHPQFKELKVEHWG